MTVANVKSTKRLTQTAGTLLQTDLLAGKSIVISLSLSADPGAKVGEVKGVLSLRWGAIAISGMGRTCTSSQDSFSRAGQVKYQFPQSEPSVTIILPVGSIWSSGLHWHERHTEFLAIQQGEAEVTLNGQTSVYGERDGVIRIERFVKHEWKRANQGNSETGKQQSLVVKEWTEPADGQKEVFFRNLNSVLLEEPTSKFPGFFTSLQLFVIFHYLDNYPVFLECVASRWITHFILGAARILGALVGLRPVYDEYTPRRLLSTYQTHTTPDKTV